MLPTGTSNPITRNPFHLQPYHQEPYHQEPFSPPTLSPGTTDQLPPIQSTSLFFLLLQVAQDTAALSGRTYTGACTFCFLQALEQFGPAQTYGQVGAGVWRRIAALRCNITAISSQHQRLFITRLLISACPDVTPRDCGAAPQYHRNMTGIPPQHLRNITKTSPQYLRLFIRACPDVIPHDCGAAPRDQRLKC